MWPFILSDRLLIVALVGRYPANWLIRRGSILYHRSFSHCTMRYCALMRYYQSFPTAIPLYEAGYPRVTHPSATKSTKSKLPIDSVRLACIKHAASVHPEPGSNSPFDDSIFKNLIVLGLNELTFCLIASYLVFKDRIATVQDFAFLFGAHLIYQIQGVESTLFFTFFQKNKMTTVTLIFLYFFSVFSIFLCKK